MNHPWIVHVNMYPIIGPSQGFRLIFPVTIQEKAQRPPPYDHISEDPWHDIGFPNSLVMSWFEPDLYLVPAATPNTLWLLEDFPWMVFRSSFEPKEFLNRYLPFENTKAGMTRECHTKRRTSNPTISPDTWQNQYKPYVRSMESSYITLLRKHGEWLVCLALLFRTSEHDKWILPAIYLSNALDSGYEQLTVINICISFTSPATTCPGIDLQCQGQWRARAME